MAQCQSEDGRQAVFVGTFLNTGDAVAVCDECLVSFCAAVLNSMTGVDPEPFLRALAKDDELPESGPVAPEGSGDPIMAGSPSSASQPAAEAQTTVDEQLALAEAAASSGAPPDPGPADGDSGA
jgi:hypothetical protein